MGVLEMNAWKPEPIINWIEALEEIPPAVEAAAAAVRDLGQATQAAGRRPDAHGRRVGGGDGAHLEQESSRASTARAGTSAWGRRDQHQHQRLGARQQGRNRARRRGRRQEQLSVGRQPLARVSHGHQRIRQGPDVCARAASRAAGRRAAGT